VSANRLIVPDLGEMADAAWVAREAAHLAGPSGTKVGCAVLAGDGRGFVGCNVQHRFRSHDIHAETNAIGNLVAAGGGRLIAVLIAAERDRFTPCGACLDWIFELGGTDCPVHTQNSPDGQLVSYTADQLMPHYPS
jgi:cytidine deaminase